MITVATFSKPEEAHLLRLRLGAGGVDAYVHDENTVQLKLADAPSFSPRRWSDGFSR